MVCYHAAMDALLKQRVICVAVIDDPNDAVPLAEALLTGGLKVIEVTFRTNAAAEAIARIRKHAPDAFVGAGTVLTPYQASQAADAGAQFLVAPGLDEAVLAAASQRGIPLVPGVLTPTEISRALNLGLKLLKVFPAEAAGGPAMLKALHGPFAHTGVRYSPSGGITLPTLPAYLSLKMVAAAGGSWMAEREWIKEQAWEKITAVARETVATVSKCGG